jgi:DNA-binding transcriptional MerR regulator
MSLHPVPHSLAPQSDELIPRYRAGAVSRMVRMPVATLRIWERRFQLTRSAGTPSSHRLYSAADVKRISLLKQLTDMGHAISTIAALDIGELRQVAATHVSAVAGSEQSLAPGPAPWRVVVVGDGLAHRLQKPSVVRQVRRALHMGGPFDSLKQAVQTLAGEQVDALLVQASGLHEESLAELQAAAAALGARRVGVLYSFCAESVCKAFTAADVALLHEPQTDVALGDWLHGLCADLPKKQAFGSAPSPGAADPMTGAMCPVPPRRYDDAALAEFAGLSTTISCECPRHVVDLLMRLSHFESYSAQCGQLSPADAALHAYLQHAAGSARHLFEGALERLVVHEGLMRTM